MLGDRSGFPDLSWDVYLNHAAVGPLARRTRDAASRVLTEQGARGVEAMSGFFEGTGRVRERFASLVGGSAGEVALTRNTSDGVTAVATCVPWRAGDRILLFEGEFPTNITPWQRAADLFDLELVFLPVGAFHGPSGEGLSRVEEVLRHGRVRLIAVSAVQFQTGLRMPLEELADLAHAHDAELFVDAIQGVGVVPLDVEADGLDYLVTGGQKWLMGPVGSGALWAREGAWEGLQPRLASWLSHDEPLRFLFEGPGHLRYDRPLVHGPAMFEGGSLPFACLIGLAEALQIALEVGVEDTFAHVQTYLDHLEEGLVGRGFRSVRSPVPEQRSGILSVVPPGPHTPSSLSTALGELGVSVSTPDGHLRFSPSWPNALAEVDKVLGTVDEALATPPG